MSQPTQATTIWKETELQSFGEHGAFCEYCFETETDLWDFFRENDSFFEISVFFRLGAIVFEFIDIALSKGMIGLHPRPTLKCDQQLKRIFCTANDQILLKDIFEIIPSQMKRRIVELDLREERKIIKQEILGLLLMTRCNPRT